MLKKIVGLLLSILTILACTNNVKKINSIDLSDSLREWSNSNFKTDNFVKSST